MTIGTWLQEVIFQNNVIWKTSGIRLSSWYIQIERVEINKITLEEGCLHPYYVREK